MIRPIDLLRQGKKEELWQMCCGFIDLTLEQFMTTQKRLLLEQIELLNNCALGSKVMRGAMPSTVEEFREQVPLTTYTDYLPELLVEREDVLPVKPALWVRTSGYPGKYPLKSVPMSEMFSREYEKVAGGGLILSCSNGRGDVSNIKEHMKAIFTLGPHPYATGVMGYFMQKAIGCDFLPFNSEQMSFTEKMKAGFEEALYQGLDGFGGLSIVLVAVGKQLNQQLGNINIRLLLSHPKALLRLTKGLIKSKLAQRTMLPRDLWSVKGIGGGGTDCTIFKEEVKELWGRYPLEMYAGVEGGIYALQTWDYEGMTFVPNLNFFEFIPEKEWFKWQLDHSYQPKTVLLDEVKAGENYEIVTSNLHGGILTRYRIGDMIKITSLRNEKLNIDIPQMVFHRRIDGLIDIPGFGRLTEKVISEAVENSEISYVDWTARKETIGDRTALHLYLELKDDYIASEKGVAAAVRDQLERLDSKYHWKVYKLWGDPEGVLGLNPFEVTLLPQGAFSSYVSQRQAEGADLEHLKPPHVDPSDEVLSSLGAPKVEVEAVPSEAERIPAP